MASFEFRQNYSVLLIWRHLWCCRKLRYWLFSYKELKVYFQLANGIWERLNCSSFTFCILSCSADASSGTSGHYAVWGRNAMGGFPWRFQGALSGCRLAFSNLRLSIFRASYWMILEPSRAFSWFWLFILVCCPCFTCRTFRGSKQPIRGHRAQLPGRERKEQRLNCQPEPHFAVCLVSNRPSDPDWGPSSTLPGFSHLDFFDSLLTSTVEHRQHNFAICFIYSSAVVFWLPPFWPRGISAA